MVLTLDRLHRLLSLLGYGVTLDLDRVIMDHLFDNSARSAEAFARLNRCYFTLTLSGGRFARAYAKAV